MFFVTFPVLWSFASFFLLTYSITIISAVIYLLPVVSTQSNMESFSPRRTHFSFINMFDLLPALLTPVLVFVMSIILWCAPALSTWFGHVVVTGFQVKLSYLVAVLFASILLTLSSTAYISSREIYDYLNIIFSIFYWVTLLFSANSLITVIFVIEVLSAALFLFVITSTFSTNYFYRNLNLKFGHFTQQITPFTYLQSLLFFFWVSLISSLNLFLFATLFYLNIFTLDWTLVEFISIYIVNSSTVRDIYTLGFVWLMFIFCLFLKCGLAPFYVWKPTFFKGLPVYTLFFYIVFFYFFLFIFLIHLLTLCLGEVFYLFSLASLLLTLAGLVLLLFILCESFYLKVFLAMSSILNSLLVILALSVTKIEDLLFWL